MPTIGNEFAGCSDVHVSPTAMPPGGALELASSWLIQSRAACAAFSPSTIPSRPETEITFPAASSMNSTTFPVSSWYCCWVAAAAGSNVSERTLAADFSYVVRSRMPPAVELVKPDFAPDVASAFATDDAPSAGRTSIRIVAFQVMSRLEGPCGSAAKPDRVVAVVVSNSIAYRNVCPGENLGAREILR